MHRREAVPGGPKRPHFHTRLVPAGDHGRHRYHQSPFRHLLLGDGALHRPVGEAREPSGRMPRPACSACSDHHDVTLIDENVEDIDFSRLTRANLVCLTGMSIQGRRMREILERVRSFGVMTVVGGPLATVEEDDARWACRCRLCRRGGRDLAAILARLGTWLPQEPLRATGEDGRHALAAAADRPVEDRPLHVRQHADLARLPVHLRVLRHHRDVWTPPSSQDQGADPGRARALSRKAGFRIVFVVDDNLIGNKKAIKPILRDIVRWQQERGYPLALSTEAYARSRRGRGADAADGSCQFPERFRRH